MTGGRGSAAIAVRGLAKSFDGVRAVAGIDFDVPEGEVFGFLGPNGAAHLALWMSFPALAALCLVLFLGSLRNIQRKWIV